MSTSSSQLKRFTFRGAFFVLAVNVLLTSSVLATRQASTALVELPTSGNQPAATKTLDTSTGSIAVTKSSLTNRQIKVLMSTADLFHANVYELDSSDHLIMNGAPAVLELLANTAKSLTEGAAQIDAAPTVHAFGELSAASQWHHSDLSTSTMWSRSSSTSSTIVAVIDTGVNPTAELTNRLVPGWDFVDNDNDPSEESIAGNAYGHGTFIAHEIAANKGNNQGGWGVCESCKIMPIRALGENGSGSMWTVAAAIDWAVANGADVINLSLGSSSGDSISFNSVKRAVENGVAVVAAAGNSGERFDKYPSYPAAYPNVLSVASHSQGRSRSGFSNYSRFVGGVDISAPGSSIWAASPDDDGLIWGMSGTSMATPIVAAVAAMTRATFPNYSTQQIYDRLRATADPNSFTMYGFLNAVDALNTSLATPALPAVQQAESVIYFSSNYGDSADPAAITCETGTSVTIPSSTLYTPTRANHIWTGKWSKDYIAKSPLYVSGGTITCEPTTLYAAWDTVPTWSSNGGDAYRHNSQCSVGYEVTAPTLIPTRSGYTFTGWNTQPDGSGYGVAAGGSFECAYYNFHAQWQITPTTSTTPTPTTTPTTTTTPNAEISPTTTPPTTTTTPNAEISPTTTSTTTTTTTTTTLPPPRLAPPPTVATTTTTTTTTTLPPAPRAPTKISPPVAQPIEQTPEETEEKATEETQQVQRSVQKQIAAKKIKVWFSRYVSTLLNDFLSGGTLVEDLSREFDTNPDWLALVAEAKTRVQPLREAARSYMFSQVAVLTKIWSPKAKTTW